MSRPAPGCAADAARPVNARHLASAEQPEGVGSRDQSAMPGLRPPC